MTPERLKKLNEEFDKLPLRGSDDEEYSAAFSMLCEVFSEYEDLVRRVTQSKDVEGHFAENFGKVSL